MFIFKIKKSFKSHDWRSLEVCLTRGAKLHIYKLVRSAGSLTQRVSNCVLFPGEWEMLLIRSNRRSQKANAKHLGF